MWFTAGGRDAASSIWEFPDDETPSNASRFPLVPLEEERDKGDSGNQSHVAQSSPMQKFSHLPLSSKRNKPVIGQMFHSYWLSLFAFSQSEYTLSFPSQKTFYPSLMVASKKTRLTGSIFTVMLQSYF